MEPPTKTYFDGLMDGALLVWNAIEKSLGPEGVHEIRAKVFAEGHYAHDRILRLKTEDLESWFDTVESELKNP